LRDTIRERLVERGRLAWLQEEMAAWQENIEHALSRERWRRISGNGGLDARSLAIIRELFHWRDTEAQRRNQPARRILRDDLIVELAKRGSADVHRIQAVRGLERGDLQRRLGEIAAAIQRGLDLPEAECPPRAVRDQVPELSVLGQFLFAALGSICREAQLAPNLVGTPNDIREWIVYHTGHGRAKTARIPQLARGWRADFVGRLFQDLLAGNLSVRIAEPKSDHPLIFEPRPGSA
jgi:ribonuclease D